MKLGSLFDGSGGFPLVAALCGITTVWASEVEPYPIAVTKSRFPKIKHLGDISKINGAEIEPVDVITFGSPCQDLSVAGKRAGLKHTENGDDETTRSGLFMEAVRIIKEMREATNGVYPRFALWENVPGAFSSNKGEDFRIVLEELIKVVEPSAVMPTVPKAGWAYADSYVGDGWSIAYRVFDAQYWGVPQRRRRIYLVADFRGECAGKILFEREGLRGYPAESGTPWQGTTADAEGSLGADDRAGAVCYGISSYDSNAMKSSNPHSGIYEASTSRTLDNNGGNPSCNQGGIAVVAVDQGGGKSSANVSENLSPTLTCTHGGEPAVAYALKPVPNLLLDAQGGQPVNVRTDGKSPTLRAEMHGNIPAVIEPAPVYCLQGNGIVRADTAGCNGKGVREDVCYTLNTIDRPAVAYAEETVSLLGDRVSGTLMARDYKGIGRWDTLGSAVCIPTDARYIVRRLTPTECARLQGFPDTWGHIDPKEDLTDEEYEFWLDVRKTHTEIQADAVIDAAKRVIEEEEAKNHPNPGMIEKQRKIIEVAETRKKRDYTKAQILTWYNKLWTDSSEYEMWGNGIAKPTALYVMQGIAEVYKEVS